jgi:hypothetical protein
MYKTDLWVSAQNLADNLPQNRYVLGYDVLGFQVGQAWVLACNDAAAAVAAAVAAAYSRV